MPTITREAIVEGLTGLLGADKVDTDEQTLKEISLDRYRKLEDIFGIYNLPIPTADVRAIFVPRTPLSAAHSPARSARVAASRSRSALDPSRAVAARAPFVARPRSRPRASRLSAAGPSRGGSGRPAGRPIWAPASVDRRA